VLTSYDRACDAAVERLSAKAIFAGKFRHHCRVCRHDSLLKRLLLFNHSIARGDHIFESALLLLKSDGDCEMEDAPVDDFPQDIRLNDRHDFEEEDPMDEDPLITEKRREESYPLRLF
jgi:hypothetical protein